MWDSIAEGVRQLVTNAGVVVSAVLGTASEAGGTVGSLWRFSRCSLWARQAVL